MSLIMGRAGVQTIELIQTGQFLLDGARIAVVAELSIFRAPGA